MTTEVECMIEGCSRVAHARGWCKAHYNRWWKTGELGAAIFGRRSPSPAERMMRKRWYAMVQRCENPNASGWEKYGARGITVCERWQRFECFLADVGYPPGPDFSLDRINNDGNYEPSNVRWATAAEQRRNQRPRVYKYVTPCGTEAGYSRHLAQGEETCSNCRRAHAAGVRRRTKTVNGARPRPVTGEETP